MIDDSHAAADEEAQIGLLAVKYGVKEEDVVVSEEEVLDEKIDILNQISKNNDVKWVLVPFFIKLI